MQTVDAVGANSPDSQASQEVALCVEERPELHVVPFALAWTENKPAPQLMQEMAPDDANLPPPQTLR